MNPLYLITPKAMAGRRAQKEAAKFEADVKPGHTYYSIVNNHGRYPGAPRQLLMEWKFTGRGRWLGQNPRCGHLTAAGAWLSYGPIHEHKPGGLLTIGEYTRRGGASPDAAEALGSGQLTPAGV